jgi:organic hydroperoxide reductase OsmC/OhrA
MSDKTTSDNKQIRVSLEQQDGYSFLVHFDDAQIDDLMTDEPAPLGEGSGPNPARLLLAAVANCLSASLLFALRKFHNEPGRLRAEAVAHIQRDAAGRWRIPTASVVLQLAEGAEQHQQLERILGQFEEFCIVTQSVRAGIEVNVMVKDAQGKILLGGPAELADA